jgi:hypothetical protein
LAACLLFTPVAMWIAVLSYGFGHGDGKADDALFPLHDAMRSLIGVIPAERAMYFGQYPLYGVFLSLAARYRKLLIAVGLLIVFHMACCVWGSAIVEFLAIAAAVSGRHRQILCG